MTYPFNRLTWWAPYGFSTLAFLGTAIGLGLMIGALRENQWQLLEEIDNRKKIENNLRESEERYRTEFSLAGEGIVTHTFDGKFLNVNNSFARMHGYTPDEMAQMTVKDLDHPESSKKMVTERLGRILAGEVLTFEVEHIHRDGHVFPLEVSASVVTSGGKSVVIAFHRDITERKKSENLLREEHQFIMQIIQSAQEGIIVYGLDLRYLVWNPFMEQLTGLPASEVLGKHPLDVFPFLREAGVLERLGKALAGEAVESLDLPYLIPITGKSGWTSNTSSTLRNIKGEIIGVIGVVQEITERKKMEEVLQESEARFVTAFQFSPMALGITTMMDGRFLTVNDAFEKLHGFTAKQIEGRTSEEIQIWANLEDRENVLAHLKDGLPIQDYETQFRCRDGSLKWVSYSCQLVNMNGVPCLLSASQDITERRQAGEKILESQVRLERAESVANFGHWQLNLAEREITASRGAEAIYGLAGGSWTLNTIEALPLPEYRALLDAALTNLIHHQQPYNVEFWIKRPNDGRLRCINSIAEYDSSKQLVFGVINDITERKAAEIALATSEAESRTMLQTTIDGVWLMNTTGRFVEVNDAACRMLGYSRDEMLNMEVSDIDASESPEELRRHIERVNRDGSDLFESVHRRKDGTCIPVEISITHISEQTRTVAYIRDISERKAHEIAGRRMNEELEQRVKVRTAQLEASYKEMEAFSYSVSHDLRSPLHIVNGFSEALLEDYQDKLDEGAKKYLSRIRGGVQRMGVLIDDLLKLSKTSRSELSVTECDLSRVCSRVVGNLADLNPEGRVEVSIQPGMLVQADNHLLRVVLENLLGNAWKFTSKAEHPRIEVGELFSADGERTLFIRDNGAGFDMAHADKLFNAFQRLHATTDFEGTGIGLAIVQRIIHRHGGRIWAEGEVGKGATFFFTIPNTRIR